MSSAENTICKDTLTARTASMHMFEQGSLDYLDKKAPRRAFSEMPMKTYYECMMMMNAPVLTL